MVEKREIYDWGIRKGCRRLKAKENSRIDELYRHAPFKQILTIVSIESLKSKSARSGESFKVKSADGKIYKLRCFDNLKKAKEAERNIKRLSGFPKCYGREGKYLLLNWIDKEIKKVTPTILYQIGKMMGEAHRLNTNDKGKTLDENYNENIKKIKKYNLLNRKTTEKITNFYNIFRKKLKVDILLEYRDTKLDNFAIDKKGKVYFIDEDGINYRAKGSGFRGIFQDIVKNKKQENAFWKGYNEEHSNDYYDTDYRYFISLLEILKDINSRYEKGEQKSMNEKLRELFKLIGQIEKRLK